MLLTYEDGMDCDSTTMLLPVCRVRAIKFGLAHYSLVMRCWRVVMHSSVMRSCTGVGWQCASCRYWGSNTSIFWRGVGFDDEIDVCEWRDGLDED